MKMRTKPLTPLKAIRANCLGCSGGSPAEVRLCVIPECPLYGYRFGKRPKTVQKANEKRAAKKTRVGVEKSAPEAKSEPTREDRPADEAIRPAMLTGHQGGETGHEADREAQP
ncbi:MAG: hypothetical protein WAU84_16095 [Thermoguttaceae bacterium]